MPKDKKEKLAKLFLDDADIIIAKLSKVSEALVSASDKIVDTPKYNKKSLEYKKNLLDVQNEIIGQLEKQYRGENLEKILEAIKGVRILLEKVANKEIPKEVAVNNINKVVDKIDDLKNNGSFTIKKQPKWYKPFSASGIIKAVKEILRVEIQNDKKKPIPVQILDEHGNPIIKFGVQQNPAGAGGGSSPTPGGGDASAANQVLILAELTALLTELGNQLVVGDLATIEASLSAIDANTDGLEALLTTIAGDTTSIDSKIVVNDEDGSIPRDQTLPTQVSFLYGSAGANWERIGVTNGSMKTVMNGGSTSQGDNINNTLNSITNSDGQHINLRTMNWVFNGGAWDRMRGNIADGLLVNLGANNNVDVDNFPTDFPDADVLSELQDKLDETSFTSRVGEVQTSPTANTVLDRLKGIKDSIDSIIDGSEAQVDVVSQPARDRATDNQGVALQTDAIMNDTTALTPKFAVISATTDNGNNTIVSAVADKKIRVLACVLVSDADDTDIRWESGAGGTALSGRVPLKESTGYVLPFNPVGWHETAVNTLLNLEITGTGNIYGQLTYVEV